MISFYAETVRTSVRAHPSGLLPTETKRYRERHGQQNGRSLQSQRSRDEMAEGVGRRESF